MYFRSSDLAKKNTECPVKILISDRQSVFMIENVPNNDIYIYDNHSLFVMINLHFNLIRFFIITQDIHPWVGLLRIFLEKFK